MNPFKLVPTKTPPERALFYKYIGYIRGNQKITPTVIKNYKRDLDNLKTMQ